MRHIDEKGLDRLDTLSTHDNICEGRIISAEGGAT